VPDPRSKRQAWRDLALALRGARNEPLAAGFAPQLVKLVNTPPPGSDWLCETKWDGYRLLADLDDGKVRLRSRNNLDWTARLPRIAQAIESLPVRSARLDGELVALDSSGNSDFDALERALEAGDDTPLRYAIYDLVALERVDLSRAPLLGRKGLLEKLLHGADRRLIYSGYVVGHAREAYADAVRRKLEGIVCKRVDSPYSFTRNGDWIKVKRTLADEFIVVGYTSPQGSRADFGSLLLASVRRGRLRYVGRVGAGFDAEHLRVIRRQLQSMRAETAPVALPEQVRLRAGAVTWVRPRMVVEVTYRGIAKLGLLRQASFLRLREDKTAATMGYRARSAS
jgi:bifunctional non-homologous end joining protein LigD